MSDQIAWLKEALEREEPETEEEVEEVEEEEAPEAEEEDSGDEEEEAPKPAPKAAPVAKPTPKKYKIAGVELDFDGDDLGDLEVPLKVDGKDVPVRLRDALRAERTYQSADKRMREVEEERSRWMSELEEKRDVGSVYDILKQLGHEDPGAVVATLAAQEMAQSELDMLRARQEKGSEDYERMEQLRGVIEQMKTLEAKRNAKLSERVKAQRTKSQAEEQYRSGLTAELPGALKAEGLDINDPVVRALAINMYDAKSRMPADEMAARIGQMAGRHFSSRLEGMEGPQLLKALPKGLVSKIVKAHAKESDRAAKNKGADAARSASVRTSRKGSDGDGVSSDDARSWFAKRNR